MEPSSLGDVEELVGASPRMKKTFVVLFTLRMRPRSLWTGPIKIKLSYGLKLYMFIYYALVELHDGNCMFILYACWHDN